MIRKKDKTANQASFLLTSAVILEIDSFDSSRKYNISFWRQLFSLLELLMSR